MEVNVPKLSFSRLSFSEWIQKAYPDRERKECSSCDGTGKINCGCKNCDGDNCDDCYTCEGDGQEYTLEELQEYKKIVQHENARLEELKGMKNGTTMLDGTEIGDSQKGGA